jgi:isoquinoline 1-oxidoreductase alpha subunit
MPVISFVLNGKPAEIDADSATPLLWVLRDTLSLTGTKFGCGAGLCGCCTVHVNDEAARSCVTSLADVAGKRVTTIEGLDPGMRARLEAALTDEQAPQCGYCMPGQVMLAADLLRRKPRATRDEIRAAMSANLCRCGSYQRLEAALVRAASGGVR